MQGVVYPETTQKCLDKMRKVFPDAEIILSTWEGTDVTGLDYDIVVLNKDPGSTPLIKDYTGKGNNMCRMIVSTQNGIKKATRKYCLKYRTDLAIKDDTFLKHFGEYKERNEQWRILKERVLSHCGTHPLFRPFHPTDITGFGLTEDILNIWDIPLPSEEDLNYFLNNPLPKYFQVPFSGHIVPRIGAESYVWSSFLKKHENKFGEIDFRHNWDLSKENLHLTELTIANNLQFLSREEFDFTSEAHAYLLAETGRYTWLDEKLWYYYYQKHCLKNVKWNDFKYHIYFPVTLLLYKCKYNPLIKQILKGLKRLSFAKVYKGLKGLSYRYDLDRKE